MGKLVTDLATVAVVRARVLELENRVRELEDENHDVRYSRAQHKQWAEIQEKQFNALREAVQRYFRACSGEDDTPIMVDGVGNKAWTREIYKAECKRRGELGRKVEALIEGGDDGS